MRLNTNSNIHRHLIHNMTKRPMTLTHHPRPRLAHLNLIIRTSISRPIIRRRNISSQRLRQHPMRPRTSTKRGQRLSIHRINRRRTTHRHIRNLNRHLNRQNTNNRLIINSTIRRNQLTRLNIHNRRPILNSKRRSLLTIRQRRPSTRRLITNQIRTNNLSISNRRPRLKHQHHIQLSKRPMRINRHAKHLNNNLNTTPLRQQHRRTRIEESYQYNK